MLRRGALSSTHASVGVAGDTQAEGVACGVMIRAAIVVAVLCVVSCATAPDVPQGEIYLWRCDGGVTFTARNTSGGNAEVVAGGRTYRLPAVIAGSGVRYFDGRVEYWEHHGEAMLNGAAGGPYENCKS